MAETNRSVADVLQDILHNLQEIVRSEVRLAKTEIREEAEKTKVSAAWLGVGAAAGLFAILFILLAIAGLLALAMPYWAATLIVGILLSGAAGALVTGGLQRLKRIHPTPERTVESIKENVEWAKQQAK